MGMITLSNPSWQEATLLSNIFIDDYMPEANGEFVKYIFTFCEHFPILRFLSAWKKWPTACSVRNVISYAA